MAIPISAGLDPLAIEAQRINENTQPPQLDAVAPLQAGIQAGKAVAGEIENIADIEKATEFEALLQSGEEGMKAALADAEAQGVDLTGVPDPKLYLRSPDDSARWYAFLAKKLETHQTKTARGEAFEQISGEDPKAGFAKLVGTGDISAAEAGKEVRKLDFDKRLQSFISGESQLVSSDVEEVPEGATVVNITEFSPATEGINASLKSRGRPQMPEELRAPIEAAAKKVGVPSNILIALASRESAFQPAARSKNNAVGLGQLLAGSTGPKMLKLAQSQGLIGEDVDFETAAVDPEMNMIMTGVLFKENLKLKGVDGDARKALIVHRAGPAGLKKFEAGERVTVTNNDGSKEDITDDITNWIGDVVGAAFGDAIPGQAPDGGNDLSTLEGINLELERITRNTEFSATPQAKVTIQELQKRRAILEKEKAVKAKAKGKLSASQKESKVASTIQLVTLLAQKVKPSGLPGGLLKNVLGFLRIDADVATLNQFSGLLAGQIAKGVGGESGRLTDQDRAFALAAMPSALDSEEIRANKIAILGAIVDNIRDAEGGSEASQKRLRKAVFVNAARFGKQMTKKELLTSWKANPSDELLQAFLWSNGADGDSDALVAKLRATLGDNKVVAPAIQQPGASTIQSRGDTPSLEAVPSPIQGAPPGGFGGIGFIPLPEENNGN